MEVAVGDTMAALIFHYLNPLESTDIEKLHAFKQKIEQYYQDNASLALGVSQLKIFLQPGNVESTYIVLQPGEEKEELLSYTLLNELSENKEKDPILFKFHPLDFIQVNAKMNQKMVNLALELLDLNSEDTVLDLFCGLGNFTLPMAKLAKWVTGVEFDKRAIQRAEENAKLNQITNLRFYVDNLHETIEPPRSIHSKMWAKQTFDKILLDPPRTGALELMELIPHLNPSRIVYVSCNPATLARDLGILVKKGYHLHAAGIMDMFPQTSHVESIAVLTRNA